MDKKAPNRFNIYFDENDPFQQKTADILNAQGRRNISAFITEAIIVYLQSRLTLADWSKYRLQYLQTKPEEQDAVQIPIDIPQNTVSYPIKPTVQKRPKKEVTEKVESRKEETKNQRNVKTDAPDEISVDEDNPMGASDEELESLFEDMKASFGFEE